MLSFGPQEGQCRLPADFVCEGSSDGTSWQVRFQNVSFVGDGMEESCVFAPPAGRSEAECKRKGMTLVQQGTEECVLPNRINKFIPGPDPNDIVCTVSGPGEYNVAATALTVISAGILVLLCFCAEAKDDERPQMTYKGPRCCRRRRAKKGACKTGSSSSIESDIELGPSQPVVKAVKSDIEVSSEASSQASTKASSSSSAGTSMKSVSEPAPAAVKSLAKPADTAKLAAKPSAGSRTKPPKSAPPRHMAKPVKDRAVVGSKKKDHQHRLPSSMLFLQGV